MLGGGATPVLTLFAVTGEPWPAGGGGGSLHALQQHLSQVRAVPGPGAPRPAAPTWGRGRCRRLPSPLTVSSSPQRRPGSGQVCHEALLRGQGGAGGPALPEEVSPGGRSQPGFHPVVVPGGGRGLRHSPRPPHPVPSPQVHPLLQRAAVRQHQDEQQTPLPAPRHHARHPQLRVQRRYGAPSPIHPRPAPSIPVQPHPSSPIQPRASLSAHPSAAPAVARGRWPQRGAAVCLGSFPVWISPP